MEILTSVKRLYIRFKSLVNVFVYSFGRAALLLLAEVQNHTVLVRERGRIRVKAVPITELLQPFHGSKYIIFDLNPSFLQVLLAKSSRKATEFNF